MAESDPAQLLDRDEPPDRLRQRRKHLAQPAVKQHRFVGADEEVIEGEAGGRRDLGNVHREAIDAVGNLVGLDLHG
jgi:hypothetical protein